MPGRVAGGVPDVQDDEERADGWRVVGGVLCVLGGATLIVFTIWATRRIERWRRESPPDLDTPKGVISDLALWIVDEDLLDRVVAVGAITILIGIVFVVDAAT